MTSRQWYIRLHDEVLGPMSRHELRDLARRGGIAAHTRVSQDGTSWIRADELARTTFGSALPCVSCSGSRPAPSPHMPVPGLFAVVLGVAVVSLFGAGFLLVPVGFPPVAAEVEQQASDSVAPGLGPHGDARFSAPPLWSPTRAEPRVARLNLRCEDATDELLRLAQGAATEEMAIAGMLALITATDTYAARVHLENTGSTPIRVYPENLHVWFRGDISTVSTAEHYRFLQPTTLQPGQSVTGLVTYLARMDIGAAMRSGMGEMSYDDPTVTVTYQ